MSESLADRFIRVIADIRAMAPADDDPMRYAIWHLQERAERVISEAIGTAHSLHTAACILKRDYSSAAEELRATPQNKE